MTNIDHKLILLVEDEILLAMSEQNEFEKYGYKVILAHSGEEAIKTFNTNPNIDLIIMDIDLGKGIDGTEAAKIILDDNDVPILFLSSHMEPDIVEKTEKITSYGYVVKNSSITVLDASIKMAFKLFYANQKVIQSEKKFRMLFDNLTTGFALHEMIYDSNGKGIDYRFLDINPAFEKLTGTERKNLLGRKVTEVFPGTESDPADWIGVYGKVVHTGKSVVFENFSQATNRWYSIIAYRPNKGQFAVIFSDITDRKITEQTMQKSELTLKDAQKIAQLGNWELDIESMQVKGSDELFNIFGISKDEATLEAFIEVVHPDDREYDKLHIQRGMEHGTPWDIEHRLILKDRTEKWVHAVGKAIKNENGKIVGLTGIIQDNTDTKKIEQTLKENNKRYRKAQEIGQVGNWEYNIFTNEIWGSEQAKQIYGFGSDSSLFSLEEIELCIPDRERVNQALLDLIEKNMEYNIEFDIITYDTQKRKTILSIAELERDISGNPIKITGVIHDISELKCKENELRISSEKMKISNQKLIESKKELNRHQNFQKAILDASSDIMYIYDLEDQENVYSNDGIMKVLGYSIEEIQKMGSNIIPTLMSPKDFKTYIKDIVPLYQKVKDGELITHEYRMKHKNGQWYWLKSKESVFKRNSDGSAKQIFGLCQNITEQKTADNKIENLLSEKEMLLKEVHHRVKNNMNVIKSLLYLHSKSLKIPEASEVFQDTIGSIQSMNILYDKLYQSSDYQEISVHEYLQQLIKEIIRMFPNWDKVKVETKIDNVKLKANIISPLGILINELITNSMKYAFPNNEDGLIQVTLKVDKKHITLTYKDDGIGIPEIHKQEDQGFGLSLIEILVNQLNGEYNMKNNDGLSYIIEFDL